MDDVERPRDYTKLLNPKGLKGVRLGVLRKLPGFMDRTLGVYDEAVKVLKREGAELDRRVIEAIQSADGFEAQVRGSLRAYLDVVKERGGLLAVLSQTRLIEGDVEDFRRGRQRAAQEFYGRLIAERYALRPRVAGLAATMLLTAADGALDAWVTGRAPRQQIEETYVRFALAGLAALEAGNGNGRAAASGNGQSRRTHRPRR